MVAHRPGQLSDNGSSYISGELADWLADEGMDHVHGAPRHPQTRRKTKRWQQTLKYRILLENYHLPGALEEAVASFIQLYNPIAITRASAISRPPTSNSAGPKPSSDERRSSRTPSASDAGCTAGPQRIIKS
ncbi:MAG: hypothetical protein C0524_15600 [Rhodobacter sp.]|nr:hypothetical protein [Rhodobacter sp.]